MERRFLGLDFLVFGVDVFWFQLIRDILGDGDSAVPEIVGFEGAPPG